jgi:AcrR family transcriptional regulator
MQTTSRAPSTRTAPTPVAANGDLPGAQHLLQIQRARILAAMGEICAERGVSNVTVAHVVARAGVSRRTYYEIFQDCEDCLLAALDEGIAQMTRHVLAAYDPRASWVARIRLGLLAGLEYLDAEPGMGQLLVVGSLGAGEKALARRGHVLAKAIAAVDEGRKETKAGGALPSLTAEGAVGGVLSVLHSRLLAPDRGRLTELTGQLMSIVVLPYLGTAAAKKELALSTPGGARRRRLLPEGKPFAQLEMRLTYRTVRVLAAIAAHPGSSNRRVADTAEVGDQGQMSKLLARLVTLGLIQNTGGGQTRGEPNSWTLTKRGWEVQGALSQQSFQS